MKKNIIKKMTALVLTLVITLMGSGEPAYAEYLDRAGSQTIYFGMGIDLFPDKIIDGKISAGLGGVKYEKPIMIPASYGSNDPFTVAKLASVWSRILELDPNPGAPVPKDVKKGTWYYSSFERLSKTHILDYLIDSNGNINPNRQLYVYEIHQSIKYYWDYSGFSKIKSEATGFMAYKYGTEGAKHVLNHKDFDQRYSSYPWYPDVKQVVEVGFIHGLVSDGVYYDFVMNPADNNTAAIIFWALTGRTRWSTAPGYISNINVKPGNRKLASYELSILQSRPHGFIN